MGGKETTKVLLKGNHDLKESIIGHSGTDTFLNGLVREKYSGAFKLEIAHETGGRADLWLQQLAMKDLPAELVEQGLSGPEFQSQFRTSMLVERPDVVIFSVQPDAEQQLWRHIRDGYLLQVPDNWSTAWSPERQRWFKAAFEEAGLLSAAQSKENLVKLVNAIKNRVEAHVVAFNCSTVDPADQVHNYFGMKQDTMALRIHRLDLALMQISVSDGISIMDADRRIAELGAGKHVVKVLHYSPEAYQAIGRELLDILAEIGFFEKRPLMPQVGKRTPKK